MKFFVVLAVFLAIAAAAPNRRADFEAEPSPGSAGQFSAPGGPGFLGPNYRYLEENPVSIDADSFASGPHDFAVEVSSAQPESFTETNTTAAEDAEANSEATTLAPAQEELSDGADPRVIATTYPKTTETEDSSFAHVEPQTSFI